MSEFEYSDFDSDGSSDEELVIPDLTKEKKPDKNTIKVSKELQLYYSNLFIDTFTLIDLFVKSKNLTYNSFLECFGSTNFHQIYAKCKSELKNASMLPPSHFITTTQDAFSVASKFLRSHSREARIGVVYLLFTLYRSQPLKNYQLNVKMEPEDYRLIKELVDKYLLEGLPHPAYCFYNLDMKRKISITATTVNPCLEANYPRTEVRKHLGRVADKYFQIEYEERKPMDNIFNKIQLMEDQLCNELAYINKLSILTLGHVATPEYKPQLSKELAEINNIEKPDVVKSSNETNHLQKMRYKNKKCAAFPGKNDDVLEDMVITTEIPNCVDPIIPKERNWRKIVSSRKSSSKKIQPYMSKALQNIGFSIDSDSSLSSNESNDSSNADAKYGDMIWHLVGEDNKELLEQPIEPGVSTALPKLNVAIDMDSSLSSNESKDSSNADDKYGDMIRRLVGDDNKELLE